MSSGCTVNAPPGMPSFSLPMRVCVCCSPFFEYLCFINTSNGEIVFDFAAMMKFGGGVDIIHSHFFISIFC